jgi:hypothetical protein
VTAYFYGAVALIFVALLGGAYQSGRNSATRECDRAALAAQVETLKVDLAAAKKASEDATRRAAEITAEADANEEKVRELESEIAKRPASDRCALGADDLKRLRGITPGRQPAPTPARPRVR